MRRFRVSRSCGITEVTFDDGGMNLLSSPALEELGVVVSELERTGGDRLVVFRSGRPALFAAGADMTEMQRFTPRDAAEFSRLGQTVFAAIERLPALTVASVEGDCFGGALDLILAFDLRLATPASRFSHPGARLGIVTGFGGTSRWRALLRRAGANRLFLANAILSAGDALTIGLVDGVAAAHDDALAKLARVDAATVKMVTDLSRHAVALTPEQLLLMGRLLGRVYSAP